MNKALKILSLLLFGSLITANTLNIEPDGNGDWNVNYTSNEDMGGFQFNVEGVSLNDAFGGDAAANGFMISTGGSMVLGFSFNRFYNSCRRRNTGYIRCVRNTHRTIQHSNLR